MAIMAILVHQACKANPVLKAELVSKVESVLAMFHQPVTSKDQMVNEVILV